MRMNHRSVAIVLLSCLFTSAALAYVVETPFNSDYAVADVGGPPGVPPNLGGLTFLARDPNTILIGGNAAGSLAAIYSIGVTRDAEHHVNGFDGVATRVAGSRGPANGGIDGGLSHGPNGVLFFTSFRDNALGQIKPGSTEPDKLTALGPLGVSTSVGALQFVPQDLPGANRLKLVSFNTGNWYDATITPDANGTFDISSVGPAIRIGGGPEGVVYVRAGNPGFAADSILVSEWSVGRVSAYEIDANGDPIVATRRTFISGLDGAEGAAIDPVTGDFLFSTYGNENRVLVVGGFLPPPVVVPEPAGWVLTLSGLGVLMWSARARSRRLVDGLAKA